MTKGIGSLFLILALTFTTAIGWFQPAWAAANISVTINGQYQTYDQPPVMVNNRTLVPLRGIFESLGATVQWNQDTHTVTATKGNTIIVLQIGSKTAYKNGQPVNLDVEAQLINDRTMVPIRFIGESLGAVVEWDQNNSVVSIVTGEKKLTVEDIGKLADRVVYIEVYDSTHRILASGSGFVASSDGTIVTNYHVIEGAASAKVYFSNQKVYDTSTLLMSDPSNDLAVLKINAVNLPVVKLGDSSAISLGESVVAIGSPQGFRNTLSTGVISSTSREVNGYTYIQTTAPIDHGSSGGALFNMKGEVIGVTAAAVVSSANLNLAIPSNVVKELLQRPQSPQPMQEKKGFNAQELADFLQQNFNSSNYKGYTFHFSFFVINRTDDPQSPSIGIIMNSPTEYANLLKLQIDDDLTIPSLLLSVAEKSHEKADGNPFVSLWLVYNTSIRPNLPTEEVTRNPNGTYQVTHNVGFAEYNYVSNVFTYSILGGQLVSIPMK